MYTDIMKGGRPLGGIMHTHLRFRGYLVKVGFVAASPDQLPPSARIVSDGWACAKRENKDTDLQTTVYHVAGVGYGYVRAA